MNEIEPSGMPGEFGAATPEAGTSSSATSTPYEPVNSGVPTSSYSAPGSSFPPPAEGYTNAGQYPPSGQYPPQGHYPPPGQYANAPAGQGLSDTAAGAIAYITIIPAIVFLVLAPYNQKPFVKFHAIQCLGLALVWICLSFIGIIPLLGWLILMLGSIALLIVWIISIIKASQGSALKLPVISQFASEQSGYRP